MRERADLMQAELTVRSTMRRGAEVRIAVPVGPQRALPLPARTRRPGTARGDGCASSRTPAMTTLPLPILPAPLDLVVFRRMADMSNEAFFLTDATAHLRYVNERAISLTQYAREISSP